MKKIIALAIFIPIALFSINAFSPQSGIRSLKADYAYNVESAEQVICSTLN
jgi:hypothetical protein